MNAETVRLPPHSFEAEQSLIGSVLIDPAAFDHVSFLNADDFYIVKHGWVWDVLCALRDRGDGIDYLTVCNELESCGRLDEVGGGVFISHLSGVVPTAIHVETYARIVKEKAARRDLLGTASDLAQIAYDEKPDLLNSDLVGRALTRFTKFSDNGHGEPDKDSGRFLVHWAAEALEPQPPIDWVIENLLSAGSVALFAGEGGSKKTWTLLDLAVCVALGQKWLDFPTRTGLALIVDEESGRHRMNRRLGDVLRGHSADETTPVGHISLAGLDMTSSQDVEQLSAAVIGSGARLVIIDALVDILGGCDENSASEIAPVFHALREIAEQAQCAVILIDHMNRMGDYRGSSAKKGACDLLVLVTTDGANIKFEIVKARDIEPIKFAGMANFFADSFYMSPAQATEKAERFSKSESYVLRYLNAHGQSPLSDILNNADACTAAAAKSAIYSLAHRSKIARVDGGGPGAAAQYSLIQEDKSFNEKD